jgi:hypothetical protein
MIIKQSIGSYLNHTGFVRPEIIYKIDKPVQEIGTFKFILLYRIKNEVADPIIISCHSSAINAKV